MFSRHARFGHPCVSVREEWLANQDGEFLAEAVSSLGFQGEEEHGRWKIHHERPPLG